MICINHDVMLQAGPGNLDLDGSETMSTDSQVSGCATGDTSSSLFIYDMNYCLTSLMKVQSQVQSKVKVKFISHILKSKVSLKMYEREMYLTLYIVQKD